MFIVNAIVLSPRISITILELCATFDTMRRLDAAHCPTEAYLAVSSQDLPPAWRRARRDLPGVGAGYEERPIARHEEGTAGAALQADLAVYLWESSVAD